MTLRPAVLFLLAIAACLFQGAPRNYCAADQPSDSPPEFRQLLQQLAALAPDPCGPLRGREEDWHSADTESRLLQHASKKVTKALNTDGPASPRDRAVEVLKKLESASAEINASWPQENRFHYQLLDVTPAIVVKMSIRTHGRFFVFGIPDENSGGSNRLWHEVGSDYGLVDKEHPGLLLDLYPLHRGPSGNARFLAKFIYSGCAGSIGVGYGAFEWDPKGLGGFALIVKQVGAFGLDGNVPGFPQIGKLKTEGLLLTLPYCWFSGIDTWDNPSLCALDTYDLSGDTVRFRSHVYNRPDLVPIAKAIEYAQQRDYRAVLAYCASDQVARTLVRDVPPFVFAADLHVIRTGTGKERVKMEYGSFDVEKREAGWVVVSFRAD